MDKKIAGIQKTAANMQAEFGRLVMQTSRMLEDLQEHAADTDEQSVNIFSARIHFQILKYQEIRDKMQQTLSELPPLSYDGKHDSESLNATRALLFEMITQAGMEEKNLSGVEEELRLAKHQVGIRTELQHVVLLDKIKKALEESRDTCG